MIHLIGPGGAGKMRVGPLAAARLELAFHDLDERFTEHVGGIDRSIAARGDPAY
jgi:shikimate kinase